MLGLGTIRINKSNADSMSSVKRKIIVVLQLTKVGKNQKDDEINIFLNSTNNINNLKVFLKLFIYLLEYCI